MNQVNKCIIILSTKSSGSSVLQRLLAQDGFVQHITTTRHKENETLYWSKAASLLGLPQVNMHDSEVPIKSSCAKQDLIELLKDNLDEGYVPSDDDKAFVFDGWSKLCKHYSPVFIEKSPHHLCQWSSIQLMLECMDKLSDVEFLFIGLVRNPMDTMYSMWSRWRSRPEQMQSEWLLAYQNLTKLQELIKDKLVIIKYEDLVSQPSILSKVYHFIGREQPYQKALHSRSLSKWKKDKLFGFRLSKEVREQAELFGYDLHEIYNRGYFAWPLYRESMRMIYTVVSFISSALRTFKN